MVEIAEFIKRVIVDKEDVKRVGRNVTEFKKGFQHLHYCYEEAADAYRYLQIH